MMSSPPSRAALNAKGILMVMAIVLPMAGSGCAPTSPAGAELPFPPWLSEHEARHPLAGVVWSRQENRRIVPGAMVDAMVAAPFVIIGEKHDNPDHHKLEAWLVANLIAGSRRPAVAFEMLTADQAPALAAYLAAHPKDTSGLGEAVGWARRGWPAWEHYRPVSQLGVDAGLPIVAADLAPETAREIGRLGPSALDGELASRLGLDQALPLDVRSPMMERLKKDHCNLLSTDVAEKMVEVQRAKDAHMAARMVEAARAPGIDGAVLVAGFGHARNDWGIPSHLRRMAPARPAVAVALMEVQAAVDDPNDYGDMLGADSPPFDFVWFTPRFDNADPCVKFQKQLERFRK